MGSLHWSSGGWVHSTSITDTTNLPLLLHSLTNSRCYPASNNLFAAQPTQSCDLPIKWAARVQHP